MILQPIQRRANPSNAKFPKSRTNIQKRTEIHQDETSISNFWAEMVCRTKLKYVQILNMIGTSITRQFTPIVKFLTLKSVKKVVCMLNAHTTVLLCGTVVPYSRPNNIKAELNGPKIRRYLRIASP